MMNLEDIVVKRFSSARSLKLRVLPDGKVSVTAPRFTPERVITAFIAKHQDWIEEKTNQILEKRRNLTASQEKLFFHGREYQFRLNVTTAQKAGMAFSGEKLIVTCDSEDHQKVRQILEKWYRDQAKKYFPERVKLLCDVANLDVAKVRIADQRSRWGSCSSRTTISLNWRLIQAPDWVSDYVIYHELSHLVHMNHSQHFWAELAKYVPKYQEAEKWLKTNHQLLNF
ncbi:MAG TPA: SprT family zinc-dependent metalloprotease [Candidatus Saccharimonadales bacterium]|nr:SprT family zinc-dependent metalloprotease [Candidatus Saccharimonadales bacterium]